MGSWATSNEFSTMLQNPTLAFRDSELKASMIERDQLMQPRAFSGAFAVVYHATLRDGREKAVRLFATADSGDRKDRYSAVQNYLSKRSVSGFVEFEYQHKGIRHPSGRWYPIVLMEWVKGKTLFDWLRTQCTANRQDLVADVRDQWIELMRELTSNQIGHGDLEPNNIMVTEEQRLKLVDYDCLYVPELNGRQNPELGTAPYQHPERDNDTELHPRLNHFSALFMLTALQTLSVAPELWGRFVEGPRGEMSDKLLFQQEDLVHPDQSELIHVIRRLPDRNARKWTESLLEMVRTPFHEILPLDAFLTDATRERVPEFPEDFLKLSDTHSEQADRDLVAAWDNHLRGNPQDRAIENNRVHEARQRLNLLHQISEATSHGETPTVAHEKLIVELAAHFDSDYLFRDRDRVQIAKTRLLALKKLDEAGKARPMSEKQLADAWNMLKQADGIELISPQLRSRLELAVRRSHLIDALGNIPWHATPDMIDRQILAIWDESLRECQEAARWIPFYDAALERRQLLKELETAVTEKDDVRIAECAQSPLFENYHFSPSILAQVSEAVHRVRQLREMLTTLARNDRQHFAELFDARLIRDYGSQLKEVLKNEVLPLNRLGLAVPRFGMAVDVDARPGSRMLRIRWVWPEPRFCDNCLLEFVREKPHPEAEPGKTAIPVSRETFEHSGGCFVHYLPDAEHHFVVVWAVVDLGLCNFYSPPLVLGRVAT